jgi:hypothetical protein
MTEPRNITLSQAHAYAQQHPLADTVRATLALSQCILGRGTHNSRELRAGLVMAVRGRLAEVWKR